MALSETSRKVFDFVKACDEKGVKITSQDIANETGLSRRQVDGSITSAFAKKTKGLMERVEAEIEMEDGKHKAVKFITLTAKGRAFDPDAEEVPVAPADAADAE